MRQTPQAMERRACSICEYDYDDREKKPAVLPCGHSYCLSCIHIMKNNNQANCPNCSRTWGEVDVNQLPICYQLIAGPQNEPGAASVPSSCIMHGLSKSFWCKTCEKSVCKNGLVADHKKCEWSLIDDAVANQLSELPNSLSTVLTQMDDYALNIAKKLDDTNQKSTTLTLFKLKVKSLDDQLNRNKEDLTVISNSLNTDRERISNITTENFNASQMEVMYEVQKTLNKSTSEVPSSPLLLKIIESYKEMGEDLTTENFLNKFCKIQNKFEDGKMWLIEDDSAAVMAFSLLTGTAERPSDLQIGHVEGWCPLKNRALLSVAAEVCHNLKLAYLTSLVSPDAATTTSIQSALESFIVARRNSRNGCSLEHLYGHLEGATIAQLEGSGIKNLGLAIGAPEDYNALTEVQTLRNTENNQLSQLSISFCSSLTQESVCEIDARVYGGLELNLLFPHLKTSDLQKVFSVISKAFGENANSEWISKLCFPLHSLTPDDVEVLLGVIHGFNLSKTVQFTISDDISEGERQRLKHLYQKYAITLQWHAWSADIFF